MKSVLFNKKPKEVLRILNGEQTILVSRVKPKLEVPYDVYVYCTKGKPFLYKGACRPMHSLDRTNPLNYYWALNDKKWTIDLQNGKVVANFRVNKVEKLQWNANGYGLLYEQDILNKSCMGEKELYHYLQGSGYALHIDNLVIFDKPKELSGFKKQWVSGYSEPCNKGKHCKNEYFDYSENCRACDIDFDGEHCPYQFITKAPQNFMYIECEVEE